MVVGYGTPEDLANNEKSYTGRFLAEIFDRAGHSYRPAAVSFKAAESRNGYDSAPKAGKKKVTAKA
jgi:hypothetical protein